MKSTLSFSVFVILLFVTNIFSQNQKETLENKLKTVPKTAVFTFSLTDLPGMANEKSTWEFSFELRLINEAVQREALKAGKLKNMSEEEKLGDLVYKNSFIKKSLTNPQNCKVVFQIPLSGEIQEKLENEPESRINFSKVKITDEIIKQSKEDEAKAHIFLLYANAVVYDAKLKQTTIVPMSRVLAFGSYPSLNFSMSLKINNEGYLLDGTLPKDSILKTMPVKP